MKINPYKIYFVLVFIPVQIESCCIGIRLVLWEICHYWYGSGKNLGVARSNLWKLFLKGWDDE